MPLPFDPNWKRPDESAPAPTLESLMTSAPVHELHAQGKANERAALHPLDFASLRGAGKQQKRAVPLTFADYFIDFLTPALIFFMMLAFILYMLDIRFIYTEYDDFRLRVVSIFFVLGVVALNRLVARDGKEQSVIYILGLGVAVVLFTVGTSGSSPQSYVGTSTSAMGLNVVANLTVVSFLWWVINRLTHECCVDKASSSGDIGIVAGTLLSMKQAKESAKELPSQMKEALTRKEEELPYILTNTIDAYDPLDRDRAAAMLPLPDEPKKWSDRMPKKHPGISIFYVSMPVLAAFVLGFPILRSGGSAMITAGYVFVGIYTVAALGLLMFTSLRGLRGYCQERGVTIPPGVSMFWMGFGSFLVLLVLLSGLIFPAPGLPRAADTGERIIDPNARQNPLPDYHESKDLGDDSAAPARELERTGEEGDESQGQQQTPPNSEMAPQQPPQDAAPPSGGSTPDGTVASPLIALMQAMPILGTILGILLGIGVLGIVGFVLLYLLRGYSKRQKEKRPGLFAAMRRFLEGLFAAAQVPGMRPWKVRMSRELSASAAFHSPMNSNMSVREKVAYSYDALCALAHDVGQPRDPDRTPHEFMREFPERLVSLRDQAEDLTRLYVIAEYSNLDMQPQVEDRLRTFWVQYDRTRNGVLR